jgi:RNA polymerase sigma-70 factor (ECF subfamily)
MGASPERYETTEQPPPGDAGDAHTQPEPLEQLYRQHFPFVWRTLRALGVSPLVLDDAVQEVFIVVHRRGKDFAGRSTVKTWLFGIAFRVAANFRRSAKRRATEPLNTELPTSQPDPEQNAERAEATRFVERFLGTLDEDRRAAFTACVLEEMTAPEAAEALGVNVNTLSSRLRIARARFSAALAKRGSQHE